MTDFSQLETYNEEWVNLFREEAKKLMELLPEDYLLEFHHIGSTAIAEMPSKPIIDIGVMITSFADADLKILPIMKKNGYKYLWRRDREPSFITYSKVSDEMAFEIHMATEEHEFWDCLYFREYLKKNADEARSYFNLKNELAKQFGEDHKSYSDGKSEYIKRITALAKKELDDF